eukprot:jgi/Orpsp1_1/1175493/evm.model.c7180000054090.1
MESARTLITQSNASLLKSSISLNISQKELDDYSSSQFNSKISLSKIDSTFDNIEDNNINNTENLSINKNNENDLNDDDNKKYKENNNKIELINDKIKNEDDNNNEKQKLINNILISKNKENDNEQELYKNELNNDEKKTINTEMKNENEENSIEQEFINNELKNENIDDIVDEKNSIEQEFINNELKNENIDDIVDEKNSIEQEFINKELKNENIDDNVNEKNSINGIKEYDDDEENKENQMEDKNFHMFDINKIIRNIVRVDIDNNIFKSDENKNETVVIENKKIEINIQKHVKEEYSIINSNINDELDKNNKEEFIEDEKLKDNDILCMKETKSKEKDIKNEIILKNNIKEINNNLMAEKENKLLDINKNNDVIIPEENNEKENKNKDDEIEISVCNNKNNELVENLVLPYSENNNDNDNTDNDNTDNNDNDNDDIDNNNNNNDNNNDNNNNNIVENDILFSKKDFNDIIKNDNGDNNIYMEKFNNVENMEKYDEVNKQHYKEKIIDNRFKLTYVLARGGCGEIRATTDLVTGKELVCKIIPRAKKPKYEKNSKTYQYYLDYELDLLKEATISSLLIHPNILYMKYMVRTANYFYLISEKINGEDLCDYIIRKGKLTEKKAKEILYEVIVALQYLHNNYIVHRDVKCENIMREKGTGRIILLDFGSACFYTNYSSQINEFCGSPVYQAPEVILSQPYWGPELDVWGLGVVLYVLTTGMLPFDPAQPNMNDSYMVDLMYNGPNYPDYLSYECKMLISRMLCFDQNQRAKLQDVLKHPWMRSYAQYQKLKELNLSNNGNQENNNLKMLNKTTSNLSIKSNNSRVSFSRNIKNIKLNKFMLKTKKLFSTDSKKFYKRYINIQKEHLTMNNPFSVDSTTLVNSIFNNDSNTNVISQMFAYAISREDETKENKIKLLKKVMNNQMRIQRNISDL